MLKDWIEVELKGKGYKSEEVKVEGLILENWFYNDKYIHPIR